MTNRSLMFVLGTLVLVLSVAPRAAHAQTSGLWFDSQAGDYVGAGHLWSYTPVDGTFSAQTTPSYGTTISLEVPGPAFVRWNLDFKSAGQPPFAGVYESARRAAFTKFVGLDVFGDGRGCNEVTGRFVVLEAEYGSNGSVTRFAADFEQHCEDADAALFGAVRYNSTVSTFLPFGGVYPIRQLTVTPPANGSIQGIGLNCGPSSAQCVVTLSAPATAPITAVSDPGFLFAGWTGGCSGGPRSTVRINMPRSCSAAFTPIVPVSPRTLAVITGAANSVVRGVPVVASPANSIWTLSPWQNGFQVQLDYVGPARQSYIGFIITPPTGETFQIGRVYQSASNADATHGSLWSASDGSGCSDSGTFTVRDWAAGSGDVPARFSIDFRQACGGGLFGTLQYASSYEYGRLDTTNTALHFTAVHDQAGIVSHSADQFFNVSPSGPLTMQWEVKSDQSWLTATPPSGIAATTVTAKVRTGAAVTATSPAIGHLQVFASGIVNVPDPVTVTLDLVPPDTTVRPFAIYRPGTHSLYLPNQSALQLFGAGEIAMSGDFNGDGVPDIALYSPLSFYWWVEGQLGLTRQFGGPGAIPVPADYNGDGITDIAVFQVYGPGPSAYWAFPGDPTPRYWGARGDVPVPGDYDGDGRADLAVFHPATGTWSILRSSGGSVTAQFGLVGDIPVVADFDADRKIDLAVFRPSTGVWYITLSTGGTYSRQFGLPADIPVPLDVTGDGRAELRVWRPSTGTWYSFDRALSEISTQQYGLPGDVPIMARPELRVARPADLDGDRRSDVTIYRPSTGEWFTRQSATSYSTFTNQQWGLAGDIPVPGDYDGDRRANAAVYRPSTGEWFVRRFDGTILTRVWGGAGDVPVPGDYDGDGRTDMVFYRPSTGQWAILSSGDYHHESIRGPFGLPGDRPMPADFDGDGRTDLAVYRPSTGEWVVRYSTGLSAPVRQWGLPGDLPIARDFNGDGRADLGIYRPSTGEWYVLDAFSGEPVFTRQWGLNGDVPVADDYDGDGVADLAIYRPGTGEWFVRPSSGAAPFVLQWGLPGDVPVTRR